MATNINIDASSKQDYLGTDVNDAIDNANAPNATNPFATLDDLTGGLPTGAIPSGYVSRVTPLVISSPTFIDVPDLSTTLEVTASVRGYCLFSFETSSTGSDAFVEFKVIINGEDSDTVLVDFAKDANANGSINFRTSANLAIGSHVVKVQARKVSGSKIPSLEKGFLFTFALQAPKGDTGAGVPVGGSANQVLAKIDGTDYNTEWITPSGGGSTPIVPMLDGLTNVATAYGVKRLKTGSHKAFRLRRATDNVESDFYFGYDGRINISELINFLYGDKGFVVTWYDQSGNNNHATQATPSLQPIVVVQNGEVVVMFENNANGLTGQMLSYTLGTPINVRNTTVFAAYESFVGSGQDLLPVPTFTKRYLLSSQNQKLDLYINSNNAGATDYDYLELFSGSAKTNKSLFAYSSANYFSINSNATELKIESNFSSETLTAVASTTETGFAIGNKYTGQNTPFAGSFYSFIKFDTSQNQTVIDKLKEDSKEQFYLIDPADSNINIVCEGDSLTNGLGATFNQNYARQMSSTLRSPLITTATSGATITNLSTRKNRVDNNIKAGKTNILIVWAGTNDMYNEGVTETNAYNSLVAYAQARKTAGFDKVYVLTCIARNSVSTIKSTFNALVAANTTDFDGVIDVAKDPRFQVQTAPFNAVDFMYYDADYIHLTNAGYRAVASMVDPFISSSNSTFDTDLPTTVRLEKVENSLKSLISKFIGAGKDILRSSFLAVSQAIYSPLIVGSTKPLTKLTLRGTDNPRQHNQGSTVIEPNGGKFVFGAESSNNRWLVQKLLDDPTGNDFSTIQRNPNGGSFDNNMIFGDNDSTNQNLMRGYVGHHKTRGMGVRSIGNLNFDFGQSGGKMTFSHFDLVVGAFTTATGTNTRFQLYDNATGTLKDVKYYIDGSSRKVLYID